jgi:hypothetical protein
MIMNIIKFIMEGCALLDKDMQNQPLTEWNDEKLHPLSLRLEARSHAAFFHYN